jgi:hypothetical protein
MHLDQGSGSNPPVIDAPDSSDAAIAAVERQSRIKDFDTETASLEASLHAAIEFDRRHNAPAVSDSIG